MGARSRAIDSPGSFAFSREIGGVDKASFTDNHLGVWKLADLYAKLFLRLSKNGDEPERPLGLVDALRKIVNAKIYQNIKGLVLNYKDPIFDEITFIFVYPEV